MVKLCWEVVVVSMTGACKVMTGSIDSEGARKGGGKCRVHEEGQTRCFWLSTPALLICDKRVKVNVLLTYRWACVRQVNQ